MHSLLLCRSSATECSDLSFIAFIIMDYNRLKAAARLKPYTILYSLLITTTIMLSKSRGKTVQRFKKLVRISQYHF